MKKRILTLLVCNFCFFWLCRGQVIVLERPEAGSFPLVSGGKAACIYVPPGESWLVRKAAELLQADVERVTGVRPEIVDNGAGTAGRQADATAAAGRPRLEIGTKTDGRWEAFEIVTGSDNDAKQPLLRITGSDRRGTAYGVLELSRQIGVSPWYWWADVAPKKKETVYIRHGDYAYGSPAVKYRGIFINDEAPAFSRWAKESFGGINHLAYEKVFELLLRLKANYLWPAMWGSAFNTDDSLSPVLADQWGIVMGTSHHEPMLRAQQEWKRYGSGAWDYTKNDSVLRAFWRKGIEHMGKHESIVTVGMRGDGDMPMTEGTATHLLETIVTDQRQIIAEVTRKPASETPQLWALYKEVQDYYDKGMRVPDDVTLLLCDDNWGNIRRLPSLQDSRAAGFRRRAGGYGIYYHFDYVGGPRNYKWINTNNLMRVWEQMHLAYTYDARQIWIVNVGDLKPMELPISFFLDYAWNAGSWGDRVPTEYYTRWATEQFGVAHGPEIGAVLATYSQWAARRKPELLNAETYSLEKYRESDRVRAGWDSLEASADAIASRLSAGDQDAYFQLVLHPVKACANLQRMYTAVAWNHFYAEAHDLRANTYADEAERAFREDSVLSAEYHSLNHGKWNHMMDQTHIGYTGWQEPPVQVMPKVEWMRASADGKGEMGVNSETGAKGETMPVGEMMEKTGAARSVSFEASAYTRKAETAGMHWQVIPGIGRTGDGVTSFPVTKTFIMNGGPSLQYEFSMSAAGNGVVHIYCSPTLNFLHDSSGLQYGISIDKQPVQWISLNREEANVRTWEKWVANNCIEGEVDLGAMGAGKHLLVLWARSPGVIFQKIVVDWGGMEKSYLGPAPTVQP